MTATATKPAAPAPVVTALHDDIDRWLATQPRDQALAEAVAAMTAAAAEGRELRRRLGVVAARLVAIDEELMSAEGPARTGLIDEKLRADVEAVVLPAQLKQAERRRALALLAVLARLAELADGAKREIEAAHNRAFDERADAILKPLAADERAGADQRMSAAEYAALLEQDKPYAARLRELRARHDAAVFVLGFCRSRAEQMGADLDTTETWPAAAERVAAAAARPSATA